MAQAGYTPIQLYYSTTAAAVPLAANLAQGELAINIADGKLYYENSSGVVTLLASSTTVTNSFSAGTTGFTPSTATTGAVTLGGTLITSNGGTGLASYTAGDLSYYASGTALTKLAIGTAGQILTSSGTAPQWSTLSGVAVTTFSAGTTGFTPSSATAGAVTLAGTLATTNGGTGLTSFTSGGVVYASSTSALATGSALTFNGNALGVTGTGGATQINLTDATSNIGLNANPATSAGFYITTTRVGSPIYIRTSNASSGDVTAMTFVSTGFVGIGVTPTAKLQVSADNLSDGILITGNDNANVKLRMVNSGSGGESWQAQVGVNGASNNNFVFRCNTTSTNVLLLSSSGSVSVTGAASTRNMFQVGSANSTLSGWILGNNSAGSGGIWSTSITPSATNYTLLADGANTTINSTTATVFAISNSEKARITSAGNLVVGTTATDNRLLVSGGVLGVSGTDGGGATVPSAAHVSSSTLRIGLRGSVSTSDASGLAGVGTYYSDNAFFRNASGNAGYLVTAPAAQLALVNGTASLRYAASGTSNTDISWSTGLYMTNAGLIGIGTSVPNAKATIWTSSTTGLQTALRLNNPFGFDNLNTGAQIVFSQDRTTAEDIPQGIIAVGQGNAGTSAESFMAFYTNNTGVTEKMRITSAGNVGIGFAAPDQPLAFADAIGVKMQLNGSNANGYQIALASSVASGDAMMKFIAGETGAGEIGWYTTTNLRMLMDSSGRFLIGGATSAVGRLTVKAASNTYLEGITTINPAGNYWSFLSNAGNDLYLGYNNADRGYFANATGVYTAVSDRRSKKNITDIEYGLDAVLALRSVQYHMNEQEDTEKKNIGFIAQEAMEVVPESVSLMMGGMYGMDRTSIVPVLVKAIQEQQAIIESLKARLDAANL